MKVYAILQIVGSLLLAVAAGMLSLVAGITVAGVAALVFGVALERQMQPALPVTVDDGET